MKKIICIFMIMAALTLTGCGNSAPSKSAGAAGSSTVQNVLEQQIKNAEAADTANTAAETTKTETGSKPAAAEKAEGSYYDVDLTKLSSTMVYSEVYSMMAEPENYIGKSVRMSGQFAIYQAIDAEGNPMPEQLYFACVIADATACCSQGLEFVLAGEHTYPTDYPELGDDIVVSGTFETYYEGEYMYCHLIDAVFE